MSKLNIVGVVKQIRSKSNVYLPIVEAIVNSIDSIRESGRSDGKIFVVLKREHDFAAELGALSNIRSVEIIDNGVGFTSSNRESFDTFYSDLKVTRGGKGFGRFMFLKYFDSVHVNSVYEEGGMFYKREFDFGKQYDIIVREKNVEVEAMDSETHVCLNNLIDNRYIDKGLDTIARNILENLLIFFVDDKYLCPQIVIVDESTNNEIVLNHYLLSQNDIQLLEKGKEFTITTETGSQNYKFEVTTFKVYFAGNQKSRVVLTGNNREVTNSPILQYIPEFEDEFYETINDVSKNYIVVSYVVGKYLDENVSLERETFNFEKVQRSAMYPLSQKDIEIEAVNIIKLLFSDDVCVRETKKRERVKQYVNNSAPWHRGIIQRIQMESIPYHASDEQIEMLLQKAKFEEDTKNRISIKEYLDSESNETESDLSLLISKITDSGKDDLVHYVCTRRDVLKVFQRLLKRRDDGSPELEKTIHDLIFPMGYTSEILPYENHNLWLLDERLAYSVYSASDKKIGSSNKALKEPDLVIFDQKKSFRNGDNEISNPLTIFEFKRPKRVEYDATEDPIEQLGNYVDDIRAGKYETPDGVETVKVNEYTPVYAYLICDPCMHIDNMAKRHQLIKSPDNEGYYGFHSGFKMYVEVLSFKRLLNNSDLRNKVFFKKLGID